MEVLAIAIKEKEIEGIQVGNREVKLSLFAEDMILYIKNFKDVIRKLPEIINAFGKVEGYRINVQKSLAFLYTKNKKIRKRIKETIPYAIAKNEK